MEDPIRNRVEESGLVQLDLSVLLRERTLRDLDLAPQLWQGLAIREQEFRSWLKDLDVTPFEGADVACLLYTSPSPRDQRGSRMPSSA